MWTRGLKAMSHPNTNRQNQKRRNVEPPIFQHCGSVNMPVTGGAEQCANSRRGYSTASSRLACPGMIDRSSSSTVARLDKTPATAGRPLKSQQYVGERRLLSRSWEPPVCSSHLLSHSGTTGFSVSHLDQRSAPEEDKRSSRTKSQVDSGYSSQEKTRPDVQHRHMIRTEQHEGDDTQFSSELTSSSASPANTPRHACYNRLNKQPDILNFKKGWMTRLDEDGQWRKHWFVLTDHILRFYRDSVAEEAADMDGEINLSSCYDITDYPAQRNYGFQIHTEDGVCTLCAMTAGIRRNWVQAVMKTLKPVGNPDVTSSKPNQGSPLRPHIQKEKGPQKRAEKPVPPMSCGVEGTDPSLLQEDLNRGSRICGGGTSPPPPASIPSSSSTFFTSSTTSSTFFTSFFAAPSSRLISSASGVTETQGEVDSFEWRPELSDDRPSGDKLEEWSKVETPPPKRGERPESPPPVRGEGPEEESTDLPRKHQTAQLVGELEKKQLELTRVQQRDHDLEQQIQEERQRYCREVHLLENGQLSSPNPASLAQDGAFQRLQKLNEDLRFELLAQRRSQEEACEAELITRAELLALKARMLSSSDASSLTRSVTVEQEHQLCQEQGQKGWGTSLLMQQARSEKFSVEPCDLQQEPHDLQQEPCDLQQEPCDLQQVPYNLQPEPCDLQQEPHDLQQESHDLQQEHCDLQQEPRDLQQEPCDLQQEPHDLQQEPHDLQQEPCDLQQEPRDLQQEPCDLQKEPHDLQQEPHDLQQEPHDLQQEACNLQQEPRDLQQEPRDLQQEVVCLRERLREVSTKLCANEKAQAEKEEHLQKHLGLLQESQNRERRILAASLAQAERRSQHLQEQLDMAEQQVDIIRRGQVSVMGIAEVEKQLQEELTRTVAAVSVLQVERTQLKQHCRELQKQVGEAERQVSQLQSRLQTEETHYYNLEHSYEQVCEELQIALGQARDREAVAWDVREGYENLLDRKERELSEILVKMAALGNSLEETEGKLREVVEGCSCASSELCTKSLEPKCKKQQVTGSLFRVTDNRLITSSSLSTWGGQTSPHISCPDEGHGSKSESSRDPASVDQHIDTAGEDPECFMSVITGLENKLYMTEEKLRDLTQRLQEPQSRWGGTDPHLQSQLTLSQATAQRLSLLLHNQAKQSQTFALETDRRTRMLEGQLQVALTSVQTCQETLTSLLRDCGRSNTKTDSALYEFEMKLVAAAACLRQMGGVTEDQQRECHRFYKEGEELINYKISPEGNSVGSGPCKFPQSLSSEDGGMEPFGQLLTLEASLMERMASIIQSQNISHGLADLLLTVDESDVAHMYKSVVLRTTAIEEEERIHEITKSEQEIIENSIHRVCTRAELTYLALRLLRRYEDGLKGDMKGDDDSQEDLDSCSVRDELPSTDMSLADISPPELAPYEEHLELSASSLEDDGLENLQEKDTSIFCKGRAEERGWVESLAAQLKKRATALQQISQKISKPKMSNVQNASVDDSVTISSHLKQLFVQLHTTYVVFRLFTDYETELQHSKTESENLQSLFQKELLCLQEERQNLRNSFSRLQMENNTQRESLELVNTKRTALERETQQKIALLLADIESMKDQHEIQVQKLEEVFQKKLRELQHIHEEEMRQIHRHHAQSGPRTDSHAQSGPRTDSHAQSGPRTDSHAQYGPRTDSHAQSGPRTDSHAQSGPRTDSHAQSRPRTDSHAQSGPRTDSALNPDHLKVEGHQLLLSTMKQQIWDFEIQVNKITKKLQCSSLEVDEVIRETCEEDLETLKASCEYGHTAMMEVYLRMVADLQQLHQLEVATVLKERDRLLKEETSATISAIEAMKKVHKEEIRRSRQTEVSSVRSDITTLQAQYEEDLKLLQRELEVLSDQYCQKCLESSQTKQVLETERETLLLLQKDNQDLRSQMHSLKEVLYPQEREQLFESLE